MARLSYKQLVDQVCADLHLDSTPGLARAGILRLVAECILDDALTPHDNP